MGKAVPGPKRPLGPPKPLLVHIFLLPDGQRTWLAVGGDETVVASRLVMTLGSTGDKLATHPELAPLKEGAVGTGGFFTARGLPEAGQLALFTEGATWGGKEAFDEAGQMPHGGLTPILFSSTAQAGGPPMLTLSRMSIPKDAIEDVVATILKHGGF